MDFLTLQYSTSFEFSSAIVRRLTHSAFSHVDIMVPGEGLLGVSGEGVYTVGSLKIHDPGGVQIRPFEAWPYKLKTIIRLKTDKADAIIARARSQLNKPFDNGALWDFLSDKPGDRDWRDESQWFCSEMVVWAAEAEDLFPWKLMTAKDRVSPADSLLIFNPFIFDEDITTLRSMLIETGLAPSLVTPTPK